MQLTSWLPLRWRATAAPAGREVPARDAIDEVRRALVEWKRRAGEAAARVAALKRRLTEAEQREGELRQRCAQHQDREQQLEARIARQASTIEQFKALAHRNHRGVPSPRLLRGLLPLRGRAASARARLDGAREAEARFLDRSAAYGAAAAA